VCLDVWVCDVRELAARLAQEFSAILVSLWFRRIAI
jgi:hypothetical protein